MMFLILYERRVKNTEGMRNTQAPSCLPLECRAHEMCNELNSRKRTV